METVFKRFSENAELETLAKADVIPLEQMSDETDKKVTFDNLNKQILHNADVGCSVNEDDATLTVTIKDDDGETIASDTVELPNTGNINCEVNDETAELTVQLKNTKGEVVTEDTVALPNTSNIDMEIGDDDELTVSLKNKSGQTVTSDSVTLPLLHSVNITRAEYDALSEAEKQKDIYYNITDEALDSDNFVQTIPQSLSDTNKSQARSNIGIDSVLADYSVAKLTKLNKVVDFNEITETGSYYIYGDTNANNSTNKPNVEKIYSSYLEVIKPNGNDMLWQRLYTGDRDVYIRTSYNGGSSWQSWTKLWADKEIEIQGDSQKFSVYFLESTKNFIISQLYGSKNARLLATPSGLSYQMYNGSTWTTLWTK